MKPNWINKATVEEITKELVSFDTVSHSSNRSISETVAQWLEELGFLVEWLEYNDVHGVNKVSLVGKREGEGTGKALGGGIAYMAHTDVVPVDDWETGFDGPFDVVEREGRLYGRGTCDMKGSLASALVAAARIDRQKQTSPLYFVVTADEEIGMQGAKQVNESSEYFEEMVKHDCLGIVGEPTELQVVHAHKGTLGYIVRSRGVSAHTSTGEGINANDALIPILAKLQQLKELTLRDTKYQNQSFDPPTLSWNMVLRNEPLAVNVTTALAEAEIFLRPMPGVDTSGLERDIESLSKAYGLELIKKSNNKPWVVDAKEEWILDMLKITENAEAKTVCYGTDGGVLQRLRRMVVCGPGSIAQAHRKDEWVAIEQLHRATEVYESAFRKWAIG